MPPGRLVPRPAEIAVTFGAPLEPIGLEREGDEPKDRIVSALRPRVAGLAGDEGRRP